MSRHMGNGPRPGSLIVNDENGVQRSVIGEQVDGSLGIRSYDTAGNVVSDPAAATNDRFAAVIGQSDPGFPVPTSTGTYVDWSISSPNDGASIIDEQVGESVAVVGTDITIQADGIYTYDISVTWGIITDATYLIAASSSPVFGQTLGFVDILPGSAGFAAPQRSWSHSYRFSAGFTLGVYLEHNDSSGLFPTVTASVLRLS